MAKGTADVGDVIGNALGKIAREAAQSVSNNGQDNGFSWRGTNGALSGMRGVVAGAGLAAAAPFAAKGAGKLVKSVATKGVASPAKEATDRLGKGAKNAVGKKIDEAGGPAAMAKEAGIGLLPGGGGGGKGGGKKGTPGVGKGRRMPVQQAVDVAVPVETAYNQWTQFEEWPQFMHRLDQATQEDDCTVSFRTKIWGMSKEFEGQIVQQRPDERIMWSVSKGVQHTGVVTFHELADRLTRVQVTLDLEPGSLLEKAARGMRHVKRAVRADLARFKAFIEMQEVETGAWRGVIEDGEVVKKHDPSYDKRRDYAEFDDIYDREHLHSPQGSLRRRGTSTRGRTRRRSSGSNRKRSGASARGRSSGSSRKRGGSSSSRSSTRGRSKSGTRSGSSRKRTSARS